MMKSIEILHIACKLFFDNLQTNTTVRTTPSPLLPKLVSSKLSKYER